MSPIPPPDAPRPVPPVDPATFAHFRLQSELVPSSSWGNSLAQRPPRAEWDRIRKQCYRDYRYRCGICGAEGRLEAHEIWHYDDTAHIQRLDGFIALCPLCHHIKHLRHASRLIHRGKLDAKTLTQHFCTVNGCTPQTFQAYRAHALTQWRARREHLWTVDLGSYAGETLGPPRPPRDHDRADPPPTDRRDHDLADDDR